MSKSYIGKSYYDSDTERFFKVTASVKAKRGKINDWLLTLTDYYIDYDQNELVEKDSGNMWLDTLKEEYKPINTAYYKALEKRIKRITQSKKKCRFLFKIEPENVYKEMLEDDEGF